FRRNAITGGWRSSALISPGVTPNRMKERKRNEPTEKGRIGIRGPAVQGRPDPILCSASDRGRSADLPYLPGELRKRLHLRFGPCALCAARPAGAAAAH